jgi:Regulator of chromosome condensation (RCC1) repeat
MQSGTIASPPRTTPAFVWGYNNRGGLGLGHTARVRRPVATMLPAGTVDVQGGVNFTVGLTEAGLLYAWGGNQYGQLGDGTTVMRWEPAAVKLPPRAKVTAIAVGRDHVVARTADGKVLAWGRNHRGQLGTGSTKDQLEPAVVRYGSVRAVAAGNGVSAAVTERGELLTWGRNSFGQLGLSTKKGLVTGLSQVRPARARLPEGARAVSVDAGQNHLAVITDDGQLVLFGRDAQGKPASGAVPLKSAWGRPLQVWAGDDFTLVLTSRHVLLALGANASGQLGTGDRANRLQPAVVTLPGAEGHVTGVWAGARGAVAVTSAHEVYTWGDASAGQAGPSSAASAGKTLTVPEPVPALAGAGITAASGGSYHVILTAVPGPWAGLLHATNGDQA